MAAGEVVDAARRHHDRSAWSVDCWQYRVGEGLRLGMRGIDMTTHFLDHTVASREGECVRCVNKELVEDPTLAGLVSSGRKGKHWYGEVDWRQCHHGGGVRVGLNF